MLNYRDVSLRQVMEDDLPFLFQLFTDPTRSHLWMRGRSVYDERGFHQAWACWSSEMMGAKFIVESAGRPVGLVFEYDRSLEDGYTKVTTLLHEDRVGHGAGIVATALIVDWLFRALPLRKVQMDVYGFNSTVVRMLRKIGFSEEAELKEVRFWNGSYWNLHMFTVDRATMPAIRARVMRTPDEKRGQENTSPELARNVLPAAGQLALPAEVSAPVL